MEDKILHEIDEHLNDFFRSSKNIQKYKSILNNDLLLKKDDLEIGGISLLCISVNIEKSKNKINEYSIEEYSKILAQFNYGIAKIFSQFGVKVVNSHQDGIYGLFEVNYKADIDDAYTCAIFINSFKYHLNKIIAKYNSDFEYNESNLNINYGIGIVYSSNNYLSLIDVNNQKQPIYLGESINLSYFLSKKASRSTYLSILCNESIFKNLTSDFINNDDLTFEEYNLTKDTKIYGCKNLDKKYLNWLKKQ